MKKIQIALLFVFMMSLALTSCVSAYDVANSDLAASNVTTAEVLPHHEAKVVREM